MKKSLLSFLTLVLCAGITTQVSAQEVGGGSADGYINYDNGSNAGTIVNPPSYVKNVKRNNGDASSAYGVAEARLSFTRGANLSNIELVDITYLADPSKRLTNAIMRGAIVIDWAKSYVSYSLTQNLNPAKKLMFHFKNADGSIFCIPETN